MKSEQHALCAAGHTVQAFAAHDRAPAAFVGDAVGTAVGAGVGAAVGAAVGVTDGDGVGAGDTPATTQPNAATHCWHTAAP